MERDSSHPTYTRKKRKNNKKKSIGGKRVDTPVGPHLLP